MLLPVNWQKAAAAVVPCYNEEATINQLVQRIREYLPGVFVVDDGSNDSTAGRAIASGAFVLRHKQNSGKGAALHTGLSAAWKRGFLWAMLLDGDGQHCPDLIPRFLSCAEITGAQLVIGNRFQEPGSMSWLRRSVNLWMSRELSRLAGFFLPDTQCGFRLVNLASWRAVGLRTSHFETDSEMVLNFARNSCRIEFIPVRDVPSMRPSHIRPLLDSWRWFRWRKFVLHRSSADNRGRLPQAKPIPT